MSAVDGAEPHMRRLTVHFTAMHTMPDDGTTKMMQAYQGVTRLQERRQQLGAVPDGPMVRQRSAACRTDLKHYLNV